VVRLLDRDLRSFADLTGSIVHLAHHYEFQAPSQTRLKFGFAKGVAPNLERSATLEFQDDAVLEKLSGLNLDKDPVFAAFVIEGQLSRWQVASLHRVSGGNVVVRFVQMDPYGEAILRERIVTESQMTSVPLESAPAPVEGKPKKAKSKKRGKK
jgi:hypothetical protein